MLARKKKATFYLPEDLLRVARVHAARMDQRDSQVVEQALRTFLGYGTEASLWDEEGVREQSRPSPSVDQGTEPTVVPESNSLAEPPPPPAEPPPPLGPDEALALALAELHALRSAGASGR